MSIKYGRIEFLKQLKKIANKYLVENIRQKDSSNSKKSWESKVLENNIKQLRLYVKKIKSMLKESSLDQFVKSELNLIDYCESLKLIDNIYISGEEARLFFNSYGNLPLVFEVRRYAPLYSLEFDLYWVDSTIEEQIDIITGEKGPEILGRYIGFKISQIQEQVIPYFEIYDGYDNIIMIINTAINEIENSRWLTGNILTINVIESLVRKLARYVYAKQNPSLEIKDVEAYVKRFQSLENLILRADWQNDIEIPISEAQIMSKYINSPILKEADDLLEMHFEGQKELREIMDKFGSIVNSNMSEEEIKEVCRLFMENLETLSEREILLPEGKKVNISLSILLEFLLRKYKDDRNKIIHGDYEGFNEAWKGYIYFSALYKVYEIIVLFKDRYDA